MSTKEVYCKDCGQVWDKQPNVCCGSKNFASRLPCSLTIREKVEGKRGFATLTPERQREIARSGGIAISQNRAYMAELGRKGGAAISQNREHMSRIGRKGGEAGGRRRSADG